MGWGGFTYYVDVCPLRGCDLEGGGGDWSSSQPTTLSFLIIIFRGASKNLPPPLVSEPVHNVYFVKYDVTVSFVAQVLDTVTYFVSHVLDSGYSENFWHILYRYSDIFWGKSRTYSLKITKT